MDFETTRFVVEIVVGVFVTPLAIVMWFLIKKLINDMGKMERALADLQLKLAEHYVPKDDFKSFLEEIRDMFKELGRKLDNKADKP